MTRSNEGNGHENGLPSPEEPFREVLHEAWREVLGQTLAEEQAQWERERKRIEAEAGEIIARLRAEIAELRSGCELRLIEKLAALRDGRDGADGAPGEPGPPGPSGEQGAPGKLPRCQDWVAGAVHYTGDVVCHQGSTWQSLRDTGHEPGHSDWICIAQAGAMPRICSTWSVDAKYRVLDVVARDGGAYIARKDDPGTCPGADWQAITLPGKRGPQGHPGERGEHGEKGGRGPPGQSAPFIVSWIVERASYSAIPILSDGKEGPRLELRSLFEQFFAETG
jgi:hypothetical protein